MNFYKLVSLISLVLTALLNPQVMANRNEYPEFLPVSHLKSGMTGYGLTVFKGNTIEKFELKILGVLEQTNSGRPLILIRVTDKRFKSRPIRIAEGMSGSPVYVNGKLIGAIAYTGQFAMEPLGLVTPIHDMLDAWSPNLSSVPPGGESIVTLSTPVNDGHIQFKNIGLSDTSLTEHKATGDFPWFQRISTPLNVSGISSKAIGVAVSALSLFPVTVRQGPGKSSGSISSLKPGSGVGFSLMTGDIDFTGVGTVTYIKGNRILAFGHPMLGIGPIQMPMSSVTVHDIFTSYASSYKLASPVSVVGVSSQDRPFSVSGVTGQQAQMIPASVTVSDDQSKTPLKLNVNIVKHPLLTPILSRIAAVEALTRKRPFPGPCTAIVTTEVTTKRTGTIKRSNLHFCQLDAATEALGDLESMLILLQNNRFNPEPIERVNLHVHLTSERMTADIERIFTDRATYRPGEKIEVGVQIRPFKQDPCIQYLTLDIPKWASNGRAAITVQGGGSMLLDSSTGAPQSGGASASVIEELRSARDVKQLLERFSNFNTNDEVVGRLLLPSASFNIEGEKLTGLPPQLEHIIQSQKNSFLRIVRDESRAVEKTKWAITGSQTLFINIQKPDLSEKQPATAAPAVQDETTTGKSEGQTSTPSTSSSGAEITLSSYEELVSADSDSDQPEIMSIQDIVNQTQTKADEQPETSEITDTTKSETKTESKTQMTSKTKVNSIGRSTKIWSQGSFDSLVKGDSEGVAVRSTGGLATGYSLTKLQSFPAQYAWSVVALTEKTYACATGSDSGVYRVTKGIDSNLIFKLAPGTMPLSLSASSEDIIWAGSSPDGAIWKYDKNLDAATKIANLPAKHISSIIANNKDSVIAASGDGSKIWLVNNLGHYQLLADLRQQSIQCLVKSSDGYLVAGTAGTAGIWKIDSSGVSCLYKPKEEYVSAISVTRTGLIFAATGPNGKLVMLEDGKSPVEIISKLSSKLTPLVYEEKTDTILVLDSDRIFRVYPSAHYDCQQLKTATDFTSAAASPNGEYVVATSANSAALFEIKLAAKGTFLSTVRDAGNISHWGQTTVSADANSNVSVWFRTGNTPEPDEAWSAWKAVRADYPSNASIARYAQWKLEYESENPETSNLLLRAISTFYLPANNRPTVKFTAPATPGFISGKAELKWTGTDPDGDKLRYRLDYSADFGKTWMPILGNKTNTESPILNTADSSVIANQIKKNVKDDPSIPKELKEAILKTDPKRLAQAAGNMPPVQSKSSSEQSTIGQSHTWDTTETGDGQYLIRITASDELANGRNALTAEHILGPIHIVNTPPIIRIFRNSIKAAKGQSIQIEGTVSAKAPISLVQYRLGSSVEWMSAEAPDGLFDTNHESYSFLLDELQPGKHTLEVKAKDFAGNTATATLDINIP